MTTIREIKILSELDHPNIVNLKEIVTQESGGSKKAPISSSKNTPASTVGSDIFSIPSTTRTFLRQSFLSCHLCLQLYQQTTAMTNTEAFSWSSSTANTTCRACCMPPPFEFRLNIANRTLSSS
jgi:serine/threonine protein kinase